LKRWHPNPVKAASRAKRPSLTSFVSPPLRVVRGAAETWASGPSQVDETTLRPGHSSSLLSPGVGSRLPKLGEWRAKAARRSTPAASSLPRCQDHGRPSDSCFIRWKSTTGGRKTFRNSAEPEWHAGCECSVSHFTLAWCAAWRRGSNGGMGRDP
jgi:hypothetical protein